MARKDGSCSLGESGDHKFLIPGTKNLWASDFAKACALSDCQALSTSFEFEVTAKQSGRTNV